jgi:hypothetical protein
LRAFAAVLLCAYLLQASTLAVEFVPRDEVKAGMKGYGLSVFSGNKPEKFDFEVLGMLKNVFPNQDIVLCRIKHPVTDKAGVIAGMSGSPLYVVANGKERLLGALAYGWSFQVDPIAGITPAYNMAQKPITETLPADAGGAVNVTPPPTPQKAQNIWPGLAGGMDTKAEYKGVVPANQPVVTANGLRPLATPVMVSGTSPRIMEAIREAFAPYGLVPLEGPGGAADAVEKPLPKPEDMPFHAGDAIGVRLLAGDMDWTAAGTVTWVDGAKVYAFGHRFSNMGPVCVPITTANVITVISSSYTSFKLAEAVDEAGSLVFDHLAAIECEVGLKSGTIPLEVTGRISGTDTVKTYRYKVADVPGLWPMISAFAVGDSSDKLLPYNHPCRIRTKVSLKLKGMDDAYEFKTSNTAPSAEMSAFELAMLLGAVETNPFQKASVESIKVSTDIEPGNHSAVVDKIEVPTVVHSGEPFTARVHVRPFGAAPRETKAYDFSLTAPLVKVSTVLNLSAAPAGKLFPPNPVPRTLKEALEQVAKQPSMETLRLVQAVTTDKGAGVEGVQLRHLPGTVEPVLGDKAAFFNEGREYDLPTEYVLDGAANAAVEVIPK